MRLVHLVLLLAILATGCRTNDMGPPTPTAAGIHPAALRDEAAEADSCGTGAKNGLFAVAESVRKEQKPAVIPPKKTVLYLSGGGAYGAYPAGVLVGWSEAGNRPVFDVVAGVSTGALVGMFAFVGPDYDSELRRVYTTLSTRDIFRIHKSIRTILGESLADNTPLTCLIRGIGTPEFIQRVATEHAKGRRLYVGTTELDGRRQVVWDMGAIASEGTAESRELFVRVLLASAAIPGFFPPVSIPIDVNGVRYQERHVDGAVTAAIFFRAPWVPLDKRNDPVARSLYDSDLYILIARKLYADPEPVKPRALTIASTSVSALIYTQTRDELLKLYTASVFTGMNFKVSSIPVDYPLVTMSTQFEPAEMGKLFDEGRRLVLSGAAWRTTPPGLEPGEQLSIRGGSTLTIDPKAPKLLPPNNIPSSRAGTPPRAGPSRVKRSLHQSRSIRHFCHSPRLPGLNQFPSLPRSITQ